MQEDWSREGEKFVKSVCTGFTVFPANFANFRTDKRGTCSEEETSANMAKTISTPTSVTENGSRGPAASRRECVIWRLSVMRR